MKKTFKDLTIFDKCYCLNVNNDIEIVEIDMMRQSNISFSNGYENYGNGVSPDDTKVRSLQNDKKGIREGIIFFNLEDAIVELKLRKEKIDNEIKKWTESLQK